MTKLVGETKAKDYSGQGAPRIVLISPIAFENTGDRNLPEGTEVNANLSVYTEATQKAAALTGSTFVDLFSTAKKIVPLSRSSFFHGRFQTRASTPHHITHIHNRCKCALHSSCSCSCLLHFHPIIILLLQLLQPFPSCRATVTAINSNNAS